MRLARKEGFKIFHIERDARNIKEFDLWYWFARRGQQFMDILKAKKPGVFFS